MWVKNLCKNICKYILKCRKYCSNKTSEVGMMNFLLKLDFLKIEVTSFHQNGPPITSLITLRFISPLSLFSVGLQLSSSLSLRNAQALLQVHNLLLHQSSPKTSKAIPSDPDRLHLSRWVSYLCHASSSSDPILLLSTGSLIPLSLFKFHCFCFGLYGFVNHIKAFFYLSFK